MFCRNCAKEIPLNIKFCPGCGAQPNNGNAFCPSCGSVVSSISEVCVKCGINLRKKRKLVSVLLAVFLGFWTWLYTYKKDNWKFWVGLGWWALFFILLFSTSQFNPYTGEKEPNVWAIFPSALGMWTLWIWAILNTVLRKRNWYLSY